MSALAPKTTDIAVGDVKTPRERWNHDFEITRILRDVLRIGRAIQKGKSTKSIILPILRYKYQQGVIYLMASRANRRPKMWMRRCETRQPHCKLTQNPD